MPDQGRILEVRDSRTGRLLGVCSGVREDGAALRVDRMILAGSAVNTLEMPPPGRLLGALEAGYWPFDLRDGHRLCYEGCEWDLWAATYQSGEAIVVEDGLVTYRERGRGANPEEPTQRSDRC